MGISDYDYLTCVFITYRKKESKFKHINILKKLSYLKNSTKASGIIFILISCSAIKKNSTPIYDNKVYICSSSPGKIQRVSEEVLFDYNLKIITYDINPTFITFETSWKIDFFSGGINKNRFKLIFTSLLDRTKEEINNENFHELYVQIIYQIYDGSSWKQINLSKIENSLLDNIVSNIRLKVQHYNS